MRLFLTLTAGPTPSPSPASTPGWELVGHLFDPSGPRLLLLVASLAVIVALLWIVSRVFDTKGSDGFATRAQLRKSMTAGAMRKTVPYTRPSLAPLSRSELRKVPVHHYAISLGNAVGYRSLPLYMSLEEVALIVAPPRGGKTAWLASRVLKAPGAVVVTSTKTDLYLVTHGLRTSNGARAWVFNPEGLGDVPSNFRWSPVAGCEDPEVALDRAAYLLSGSPGAKGVTNRSFWEGNTNETLRAYLHAAALAGLSMRHVWEWSSNPADLTAVKILNTHPKAADGWAGKLAQTLQQPRETRDNIFQTLSLALAFMANPKVAATMQLDPGESGFDIDEFLTSSDTLYLLGASKANNSVAPLFTAFTGALFERAKWISQSRPGGRLDPPVTFALDEAALICPVPLEQWTADAGGRGIPLLIAVQNFHQLYVRYGRDAGKVIYDNCAVKLILGGSTVTESLEDISKLCGTRQVVRASVSRNADGSTSTHKNTVREPVMPEDAIRRLPQGRALVIHRSTPAVLVNYTSVWKDKQVRDYFKATGTPLPADQPATSSFLPEETG